ncbi:O-antigen ligase family protein [Flavobacterium sp.]|uniref:O-antigen ligase family protein n=1 Tax=Flavobacterium sp. TaxID=239 RepID=UPI0026312910|nr:O-antigen ligase family protein [Flavobacterium sp.]
MKINATKFYTLLFIIIVFLQLYVYSFRFNIFLQFIILSFFLILEKPRISTKFLKFLSPVVYIFIIGFFGTLLYKYNWYNIVKDIFHFIKPVLGLLIGYCFYRKINNFKLFVQAIVLTGLVSALVHFGLIISISNISTVADIRQHGTDNFIELVAVLFLSFYKKFENENLFQKRANHRILFWTILISSILYFSRTMIVTGFISLLSIYGYTVIKPKTIKIASILLLSIVLLYTVLFSVNIRRDKDGITSFLYKIKNAPAEVFKTKIDREDHTDLWDHWRGYEAKRAIELIKENPEGIVFGLGYGSLVNLKFFAPLSDDEKGMKYISELHNGYAYILYKVGIVGLFLYLFFLNKLYKKIYQNKNFKNVFISAFGLSLFVSTLVTVGINNSNEILMFIVGALLFFSEKNDFKTQEIC